MRVVLKMMQTNKNQGIEIVRQMLINLFLLFGGIIMVTPFLWMAFASIKTEAEIILIPPTILPRSVTLQNFVSVFNEIPLARYFLNSCINTLGQTLPGIVLVSVTGYVLAKMNFVGKKVMLLIVLATMMVPFHIRLVPLYMMMVDFDWVDTYWAIIIPGIMGPFGVFLFRQSFLSMPTELIDSAKIEGCGAFRIFWSIALPLVRATIATFTIFAFMWNWTDFLWPLVVIHSELMKPLEVGLTRFMAARYSVYGKVMAGSFLSVLPVLAVFLVLQKQFIKGITLTGLKG